MRRIYKCKGDVPNCKSSKGCYKNGGECHCTTDISHAQLFVKKENLNDMQYEEIEDERIRISEKVER